MKRLLTLLMTLSVASCDSSTKTTDGTSSETQSSLQALADNVRRVPASPSGASLASARTVAGRASAVDACPEFGSFEQYWPSADLHEQWRIKRSRLLACGPDSSITSLFAMYRDADDSATWTLEARVTVLASGNRISRNRFETPLGGGFVKRHLEEERTNSMGGPDGDAPWALQAIVVTNEAVEVDLLARTPLTIAGNGASSEQVDTTGFRCPIYDLTRGRVKIGDFYALRGGGVEVRDLEGHMIAPRIPAPRPQPDTMGLRLLANASDADSVRLSLRLQTLEPPGFASAATALVLADSTEIARRAVEYPDDALPQDPRFLVLGKTGFAVGTRIDWHVPRAAAYDRVCVLRSYPRSNGMTSWHVVAVVAFDGRVVSP